MQKSPRRRPTHDAETRQCIIAELRLAAKGGLGTLADQGAVGERKAMLERLVYSRQSPIAARRCYQIARFRRA